MAGYLGDPWYYANTVTNFPITTTTAATTNVFNYQQALQLPQTLLPQYRRDSGGYDPPSGLKPVLRRQMPGSDGIEWMLSNGARVQFSAEQIDNNHALPFTPAEALASIKAKAETIDESADMAWLRGQVEEIRELAFA